jgi:DNA-binding MurR/RpiR family transcriptional regulator
VRAVSLSDRLRAITLTSAERRVAEIVLGDPERVAFGTVADLARLAGTGGATVMRLAAKAGFDGFSELQSSVQSELSRRLRPAVERIREPKAGDTVASVLRVDVTNLQETLGAVDGAVLTTAVNTLVEATSVSIIGSDAARPVAVALSGDLGLVRPDVREIIGGEVATARQLSRCGPGDVVVVIDVRRYDRLVVAAAAQVRAAGASVIALTDSVLSPVAADAVAVFTVAADGVGPFDSYVGALAIVNVLIAEVAARLSETATAHLDRVEAAWNEMGALVDE